MPGFLFLLRYFICYIYIELGHDGGRAAAGTHARAREGCAAVGGTYSLSSCSFEKAMMNTIQKCIIFLGAVLKSLAIDHLAYRKGV
jgi:hypothetical protein